MVKKFIKNTLRQIRSRSQSSEFSEYKQYVEVQHRCAPKEFMDHRLNIVSGLAYALNSIRQMGISKRAYLQEGDAKGQLIEDRINILDAGSRDGWVVEFLKSIGYPNAKGVELLQDYVDYAKAWGREVVQGDLHNLPFEEKSFDFVHTRHTLEHCLEPVKVLNELLRVTKTKGAIYCSFPLVNEPHGKHTLAIPNVKTIHRILQQTDYPFEKIYIGETCRTPVIPEGDEVIIFITKK